MRRCRWEATAFAAGGGHADYLCALEPDLSRNALVWSVLRGEVAAGGF